MTLPSSAALVLDHQQILDILHRMAYQLWEELYESSAIGMITISERAHELARHFSSIWEQLDGAPPLHITSYDKVRSEPTLLRSFHEVVLFDDVINTGTTMFQALGHIAAARPQRVVIAVLVNRDHLLFPVHPEIVGHTLSTTYQEHIYVIIENGRYRAVLA